jgi:hypothetical protein
VVCQHLTFSHPSMTLKQAETLGELNSVRTN